MRQSNRICIALALSLTAVAGCSHATNDGTRTAETSDAKTEAFGKLTIEQLQAKLDEAKSGKVKLAIFDNNQKERFEKGHIPTAKWVKYDAVTAADLPSEKDATLVFYCANEHCTACHSGAAAALALGYKNVFILPAGIQGWEKAQKPTEQA